MSPAPTWLTARPIAHRGLHDRAVGRIENTLSAARAAVERDFAIECDVQLTRDGDAVVFHDFALARLVGGTDEVRGVESAALQRMPYRDSEDRIASLPALLDLIAGRVPLICEIKSRFDGDLTLTRRVAAVASAYAGPIAVKSFDPEPIGWLRTIGAPFPLGIVAEAHYEHPEWAMLSAARKRDLAQLLHFAETRPDFLSWHVGDLPHAVPYLCRTAIGCPVVTWTVRTEAQRAVASRWTDQMVFEGFLPEP